MPEPHIDPGRPVTIAVDASSIKVAGRGEWIRTRWRRRRGFLKTRMAVDVKTRQIVSMEVTDEGTGDGGMLEPLVEQAEERCRVVKALADGAYDSRSGFTHLEERGEGGRHQGETELLDQGSGMPLEEAGGRGVFS